MNARNLRKLLREPLWFALLGAPIIGACLGTLLARERVGDATVSLLGKAWNGDPGETRAVLAGLFGFQVTVFTVALSLNASVVQSAANKYSPRLIPLYVARAPMRRAFPLLLLSAAYDMAAARELGLITDESVRPRLVVSGGVILVFLGLSVVLFAMLRTFRFIRVERVLELARDATYAAAKRVRSRVEHLPLDAKAALELPLDASALVARESGYLVDVDLRRLAALAENARVRTRICHAIGDYVDEGEVIGWVASDDARPVDSRLARDLAVTLTINPVRELDYDPGLGIRIIVDIANRSLSSSVNDPYTARQALNQLRSVLRHVGRLPLGDWNVVDRSGAVRVSVMAPHLREFLALATSGPLRYDASDPTVLEGLLEIVLAVLAVARDPDDHLAACRLFDRIEGLAEQGGEMDPDLLQRFRAEAAPLRHAQSTDAAPSAPG